MAWHHGRWNVDPETADMKTAGLCFFMTNPVAVRKDFAPAILPGDPSLFVVENDIPESSGAHHAAPRGRDDIPTIAMTNLLGWARSLVLVALLGQATAGFTNGFGEVTAGSTLGLKWTGVEEKYYPLCVTAQLIEKGGDGVKATAYKANVTVDVKGNSFSWTGVPYPLRHATEGMYQLELRPVSWDGGSAPVLAKSPFFKIGEAIRNTQTGATPTPTLVDYGGGGGSGSGVNRSLAIGLGVAIGVPSVIALALVSWCFRKRQRRATMEKRRRTRRDFVIN
ncbi:hypothetical protein OQA88_11276 [Cercophora sp. LCS_1]